MAGEEDKPFWGVELVKVELLQTGEWGEVWKAAEYEQGCWGEEEAVTWSGE